MRSQGWAVRLSFELPYFVCAVEEGLAVNTSVITTQIDKPGLSGLSEAIARHHGMYPSSGVV